MKRIKVSKKYLRSTPRKTRLLIDMIRNKPVDFASEQLKVANKMVANDISKLLDSAVAQAKDKNYDIDKLYIVEATVNDGPRLKRHFMRSRGRATRFSKDMCHVALVLAQTQNQSKDKKVQE